MPLYDRIVVLTGAGLSAESGVSTFRDPAGIWAKYDWREVATPEGFDRNPDAVHDFYNMRRRLHTSITPNAAHFALARLEAEHGGVVIVTQNVDALHEAAGTKSLIHMHGEALKAFCSYCASRHAWHIDLATSTPCPSCTKAGGMRPDVVWFGETPYDLGRISDLLLTCDLFVSIGTSGNVYPAAGFVTEAKASGARTIELNLEPSQGANLFDEAIYGPATEVVPHFVERLLGADS
ncbi:MAG: NAD-dependent deacylase [Hyphomicrobium sp.]|nr:NAD-dependent deacylase [Hyphomicrobium sp.]